MEQNHWSIALFNKSVLKQQKFRAITKLLGPTEDMRCLDIGGDNGVISYLLRQRGGQWSSADLDATTVASILSLVDTDVYQLEGADLPFDDDAFDRIVVIDYLEHVGDDQRLVENLYRVLKPGGFLIVNVPNFKDDFLYWLRNRLGQTDAQHGHVRPGYTVTSLKGLLDSHFEIVTHTTYSGFCAEFADTLIVFVMSILKGNRESKKGLVVTGQDLDKYRSAFRFYSLIYPFFRAAVLLDSLLRFATGYKLIVKACTRKGNNMS